MLACMLNTSENGKTYYFMIIIGSAAVVVVALHQKFKSAVISAAQLNKLTASYSACTRIYTVVWYTYTKTDATKVEQNTNARHIYSEYSADETKQKKSI